MDGGFYAMRLYGGISAHIRRQTMRQALSYVYENFRETRLAFEFKK